MCKYVVAYYYVTSNHEPTDFGKFRYATTLGFTKRYIVCDQSDAFFYYHHNFIFIVLVKMSELFESAKTFTAAEHLEIIKSAIDDVQRTEEIRRKQSDESRANLRGFL